MDAVEAEDVKVIQPVFLKLRRSGQVVSDVHPVDFQSPLARLQPGDCALVAIRPPGVINTFKSFERRQRISVAHPADKVPAVVFVVEELDEKEYYTHISTNPIAALRSSRL